MTSKEIMNKLAKENNLIVIDRQFRRADGLGNFSVLPNWIINKCLSLLDIPELCSLAQASREWKFLVEDEDLWKKISRTRYKGNLWFRGTWKRTVVEQNKSKYKPKKEAEDKELIDYTEKKKAFPFKGLESEFKKRYNHWFYSSLDVDRFRTTHCDIDKRSNLSLKEFIEEYDKPQKPVIITDALVNWPAFKNWNLDYFEKNFGHYVVRAGSGFRMSISHYIQYLKTNNDYAPLYMFDGKLDERAPNILKDFSVPIYFEEDFYADLTDDDRPPYRWIMLGGKRTGPAFHIDPYKTGAWNAVIFGSKRWTLYPPHISPPGAGDPDSDYYEAPRPIKWLTRYESHLDSPDRPIEFMHNTGELLFLPGGWWHQVINVEETLAVTQNYVNSQNFAMVHEDTKKDPDFHHTFTDAVLSLRPHLKNLLSKS